MTVWRICIACWVTKATKTPSEYVRVVAFPPQQLLHNRALLLHCYVHFLSCLLLSAAVELSVLDGNVKRGIR